MPNCQVVAEDEAKYLAFTRSYFMSVTLSVLEWQPSRLCNELHFARNPMRMKSKKTKHLAKSFKFFMIDMQMSASKYDACCMQQLTGRSSMSSTGNQARGFALDAHILRVDAVCHFPSSVTARSQLILRSCHNQVK